MWRKSHLFNQLLCFWKQFLKSKSCNYHCTSTLILEESHFHSLIDSKTLFHCPGLLLAYFVFLALLLAREIQAPEERFPLTYCSFELLKKRFCELP